MYSLSASRTQLLAHQFKPLVKFLESVHRRYLIADEVGLGKTIEAGIIISELRARQALGGVLVICPNHLRDKWRTELQVRFDEEFQVITSRREWLSRTRTWEKDGTEQARFIVGHKTIASRRLLEEAEEGVPSFDLIIVDEAHYARNTATVFRRLLGELADAASQLLLLTATPLQTHVDNLLSLLRLLDEAAFRNRALFEDRIEANRRLVRAEIFLRRAGPSAQDRIAAAAAAREELQHLGVLHRWTFGLDDGGRLTGVEDLLEEFVPGEGAFEAIASAADRLRDLNLLSPYITRTRKVDVQDTCQRRVRAVRPDLSPEERQFYDLAVQWLKDAVAQRYGRDRVAFLTREPERRLASCFHGFWRRMVRRGLGKDAELGYPPRHVQAAYDQIGDTDTKYEHVLDTLKRLWTEDPTAKVLLFASFRATIRYLRRRLEEDGIEHEWIHGGVPMDPVDPERDERGKRVRRFLFDPACRVLISSNVGGEGIDLQAASVVVNYDLPWNPSVIEQRIGRVDRFGQLRSVVQVLNVILPQTVEDLIFTRLIDRLHLFQETVGDIAAVLGPIVSTLSAEFLSQEHSPEEIEVRLNDAEFRGRNQLTNRRELLLRENEFIAFDQDFMDVIKGLDAEGRTFRPVEVFRVCEGIIQRHFKRSFLRRAFEPGP